MAITVYSVDADLVEVRPNILQLGVDDWTFKHKEAFSAINRVVEVRWYKEAALEYSLDWRDNAFSPDLVEEGYFKDLSVNKTLELAYLYLMNAGESDPFERQMRIFRDRYNEELKILLATGINYDWDGSGVVVDTERYHHVPRRLTRV